MMKCEHLDEVNRHDLYFWYPDGTEAGYLCDLCATQAGFCPSCGGFVARIDREIPYIQDWGMCYECYQDNMAKFW